MLLKSTLICLEYNCRWNVVSNRSVCMCVFIRLFSYVALEYVTNKWTFSNECLALFVFFCFSPTLSFDGQARIRCTWVNLFGFMHRYESQLWTTMERARASFIEVEWFILWRARRLSQISWRMCIVTVHVVSTWHLNSMATMPSTLSLLRSRVMIVPSSILLLISTCPLWLHCHSFLDITRSSTSKTIHTVDH
jgi:hypothetical protein